MTKGPLLQEIWNDLSEERKQRIEKRAEELETQYLTLQELRKEAGLTQARVSQILEMPQSNISRLEQNSDMLLSTLRNYVEAMGGQLNLTVELPGKPSVTLVNIGDLIDSTDA